ncbi:MAG TPA: CPBP family intramembrane glutamic endopeptidase [Candidatus Acidoferrales bacterium]|nr:CPBP family intramembrane glutamic endopeptidase [Candidatus Acidoferrales bacterium]
MAETKPSALRWIFVGSGGIRAGWSIAIFGAIVAAEVLLGTAVIRALDLHAPRGGQIPPIGMVVIELILFVAIAIPTFVMSRIEGRPFLSYGYSGPRKLSRLGWGMLAGFVALCALVGILALCRAIVFDGRTLSGPSIAGYGVAWAFAFLLVGISEESWLRGYLLFTLARGLNFFWASIILSIAFGAIHSSNPGESPIGLVGAACIGLVFCFSIWLTGSLYWAIGAHAAWDWAQSYFFGVADSGLRIGGHLFETHAAGSVYLSGGSTGPEGSILCPLIVLLIGLGLYRVWGRQPALRDKRSLFAQSSS